MGFTGLEFRVLGGFEPQTQSYKPRLVVPKFENYAANLNAQTQKLSPKSKKNRRALQA